MNSDRRQHDRIDVSRPCKVFHWPTQRYLPARACNASAGGLLLEIDSPRPIGVEDPVDVLISWTGKAVLTAADQVRGRVIRSLDAPDGAQFIAVEFDRVVGEAALAA